MPFLCSCKNHIFIALFLTAWRQPPGSHLLQNLVASWFLSHIYSLSGCAYTGTDDLCVRLHRWSLLTDSKLTGALCTHTHGACHVTGVCGTTGAPWIHVLMAYGRCCPLITERKAHFWILEMACSWGWITTNTWRGQCFPDRYIK